MRILRRTRSSRPVGEQIQKRSLLSIGSAAGVALMGQTGGRYNFSGHLKWTWAIALGYAGSIGAHFLLNVV